MGRSVHVPKRPLRIVSLVPSQTELLYDLGLGNRVVGITKFCVHPKAWFHSKERIGGTKKVDFTKVRQLSPDLIIGNKEENLESDIRELEQSHPVWMSDITNLDDALEMILSIGQIVGEALRAKDISERIRLSFENGFPNAGKRVVYLIWKSPFMAAGKNTFINEMLQLAGFENAISDPKSRYPQLTESDINALKPDLIFLSSEPFPFKGKHAQAVHDLFPDISTTEVDGEIFSWYGSRLLHSSEYFKQLKHQV